MTKRKEKKLPETIEEVVANLSAVDEEIRGLAAEAPKYKPVNGKPDLVDTIDSKRAELIKQSEEGELDK